jgi:hypothetical protein
MLLICAVILLIAIEGIVCLIMAVPLAVPLDLIGALIGVGVMRAFSNSKVGSLSVILLIASLPFLLGFENSTRSKLTVHKVVSTVEIDAPIAEVWKNVIAFPRIEKSPEGILRAGFAYPIEAKIDGTGVGAIRYCNFNTGPFVEPITEWQEPNLLAFDVIQQPAPMVETSPYGELHTAHLEYLRSQKGQFRLYENDGKTVVEGTTFYIHDIAPDIYWKLYSDEIIHQIHMRGLESYKGNI